MTSLLPMVGRGALAGTVAGLAAGVTSYVLVEPVIRKAIEAEEARSSAATAGHAEEHAEEIVSRAGQEGGLLLAFVITGLAIGILFAVAYAMLHRGDLELRGDADPWRRSLLLAGGGFLGAVLLPFLRYPANPPGVGDPATIGTRTWTWVAAIVIGIAVVAAAVQVARWLSERGAAVPVRQLAAAATVVAGLALLWVLPANNDEIPGDVAGLLWDFRVRSLAASAVLWGVLGAAFGLAGQWAARRSAEGSEPATTAPAATPA